MRRQPNPFHFQPTMSPTRLACCVVVGGSLLGTLLGYLLSFLV